MSQVHISNHQYVPGPVIYCPWSIIITKRMAQGQSNHVPGPSLLPKEWPRDIETMSQVHISDHQYVPGPVMSCPWYIIINGTGTIKMCPRSIFLIINMSQGLSFLVPGPSLLLEEWTRDY